jgi:hypothetical protein
MTDTAFEERLRGVLAEAADTVSWPEERVVEAPAAAPAAAPAGRRTRRWMLVAAAGALLCGAGVWGSGLLGPEDPGDAKCAAVLDWHGTRYTGYGEVLRVPITTEELPGRAVAPRCDDGGGVSDSYELAVSRIPGVPPDEAFLAGDGVYVSGPITNPRLRSLFEKLPCTLDDTTLVTGQALGVLPAGPADGRLPEPPYRISFRVDTGDRLLGEDYAAVIIQLHVSDETVGGSDDSLVISSLWDGATMSATIGCVGTRYAALSLGR